MNLSLLCHRAAFGLALIIALIPLGCGSDNLAGPSGNTGVTLRGTVLGAPSSSSSEVSALSGAADTLTVQVLERPEIVATVAPDGTFTLRGLPEGSFTLVVLSGGTEIGRIPFDGVRPNQEITVTLAVNGTTVTVVEQKRNGIGHGDLEIEGLVEQVLTANPTGESRFVIDGRTVVAQPGQTSIRQGNRAMSVLDVTVGRRVHVKGVWMAAVGTTQDVLAHEIKLQGNGTDDGDDDGGGQPACVAGTRAQVEGRISAISGTSITVPQHGRDNVAETDSGTRIRKGNTTYTFADLQVGNRVHVSGRFLGLSGSVCRVDADEIKLQN